MATIAKWAGVLMRRVVINLVVFMLAALPGPAETRRSDNLAPHVIWKSTIATQFLPAAAQSKSNAKLAPQHARIMPRLELDPVGEVGLASWYGDQFNGRPTANGEIFDKDKLSAAHLHLPLGTWIKVTNLGNHRSLVLRVNDRGPYVEGRVLDLSERAAERLGFMMAGTAMVDIHVLKAIGTISTSPKKVSALSVP